MDKNTYLILGLIGLNNQSSKYSAIIKNELFQLFITISSGPLMVLRNEFEKILKFLEEQKLIYEIYDPKIASIVIISENKKLFPVLSSLLEEEDFHHSIIQNSHYLNHLINSAYYLFRQSPSSINDYSIELGISRQQMELVKTILNQSINKFEYLKWSGLICSEFQFPEKRLYLENEQFSLLDKIYKICYYLNYWVILDPGIKSFLFSNFQKLDANNYTQNFMANNRFNFILNFFSKDLKPGELLNLAKKDLIDLHEIGQFYFFTRTWRKSIGEEKLQDLANNNRKEILLKLSKDGLNSVSNPYELRERLISVLRAFKWEGKLNEEISFLTQRISEYVDNYLCPECKSRSMVFLEGTMICTECAFAMEM
ncbi:MAG: hypothetical protein IH594_10345 [Bacteroidales bacterium]|nr:hypothetical protein [Bacteroidales bacterium]